VGGGEGWGGGVGGGGWGGGVGGGGGGGGGGGEGGGWGGGGRREGDTRILSSYSHQSLLSPPALTPFLHRLSFSPSPLWSLPRLEFHLGFSSLHFGDVPPAYSVQHPGVQRGAAAQNAQESVPMYPFEIHPYRVTGRAGLSAKTLRAADATGRSYSCLPAIRAPPASPCPTSPKTSRRVDEPFESAYSHATYLRTRRIVR